MSNTLGTRTLGEGFIGQDDAVDYTQLANPLLLRYWPWDQIRPTGTDAASDLLFGFDRALRRLDARIEQVKRERFVHNATGASLDHLAGEVGITRQTDERDPRLRLRTRIAKAVTRSQGTLGDMERILQIIFGDAVNNMSITTVDDKPVVILQVPVTLIDEIPLTKAELETALQPIIPASDELRVKFADTFLLNESGQQGLSNGALI